MLDLNSALSADLSAAPVLDARTFRRGGYRDGSALKFRGVVQDVQDPELVMLGGQDKLVERLPLVVSLFPHASDWAQKAYADHRDAPVVESTTASKGTKRPMDHEGVQEDKEQEDSHAKKPKVETTPDTQPDRLLLPDAVNIYVYEGQYEHLTLDAFKVNEAFEFVGVLDLMVAGTDAKIDAELTAKEIEEMQISDCIEQVQRRQKSGVVLHCCRVSSLQNMHHVRPHETSAFYDKVQESNDSRTKFCQEEWARLGQPTDVAAMRQQLIDYLAPSVRGDRLAAEYVLLVLLSRVYARADQSTPLGNLSLNLALDKASSAEHTSAFVAQLHQTLASLMPMVARVDLSLKDLNATKFMPYKDYEREVLLSGVLQVANGTTMLVNETALTTGQLNDQGVKNVAALQSLIDKMLLPYDFHYYNMDFPQDVAIVAVSEGKSILPVSVAVPLDSSATNDAPPVPEEKLLECFRVFLSVLRSFTVTIGNEEAEIAEKHYVACRKSEQKVALEDLHRWLRLARLMALSRGEGQISRASWDAMLALETQRLARSSGDN